jgi:hypothetical protein
MDPNILTRASYPDVFDAFAVAFREVLEESPERQCINVLCAQWGFETHEGLFMHDWNVWNLRGWWQGHGTTFKAGEINSNGQEVLLPPGPDNVFRAYPDLATACRDAVRFIFTQSRPTRPNRYAAAADAAREGDVDGYVRNLRGPNPDGTWTINGETLYGFFTANPAVYMKGCEHFFWKYQALSAPPAAPE